MNEKFLKPYDPTETEDRIYKKWLQSGYFNPDNLPKKQDGSEREAYTIVLPPPNVTGTLHMGHAAMLAIEDILIRYKRMQGYKALWIPGTDHAAIATQSKVEKEIEKKEGKRRHDLGREEFLKRVNDFAQASHDTIVNQIKKMGASIDWSREAFTLDEKRTLAVRTAFKTMYDLGLIYRGYRIVNWDPKGQTTISDDEIVYVERKTKIYTFKYSKDFPISIATTRPETKVGDTGVAVHPDDVRYKKYIGKTYNVDFAGAKLHIKIVADIAVDPEYGTGAVGVTPAHSATDADIAGRHELPTVQVISELSKMMPNTGIVEGMKVIDAREKIVEWLKEQGLLEKEEENVQNVSTAERTGAVIEPLPKLQWFVDVNKKFNRINGGGEVTLKEIMISAVESGDIKILPDRFEKVYFNWINNLRDWCISRQIWYGHRIPVWYKGEEIYVGIDGPKESEHGDGWKQDEDTLDTWFSSGLWTFSTLGWPEKTNDLITFHPTSVLETGYDILFFWVARMILMTGCLLGTIPFRTVYLHGLVRTAKGEKMSKSKPETNIDPLDMIAKYGADATRLSLIVGNGLGSDLKLSEDKVRGYKNFSNKLWNIARFIFSSVEGEVLDPKTEIPNDLKDIIKDITVDIENYRLYLAAEKLYHYTWHTFADVTLEESKKIFKDGSEEDKKKQEQILLITFTTLLKALHPFIPFVTEEIWTFMPIYDNVYDNSKNRNLLMISEWPK
jgi:valyl-tRNA synthetase